MVAQKKRKIIVDLVLKAKLIEWSPKLYITFYCVLRFFSKYKNATMAAWQSQAGLNAMMRNNSQ